MLNFSNHDFVDERAAPPAPRVKFGAVVEIDRGATRVEEAIGGTTLISISRASDSRSLDFEIENIYFDVAGDGLASHCGAPPKCMTFRKMEQ